MGSCSRHVQLNSCSRHDSRTASWPKAPRWMEHGLGFGRGLGKNKFHLEDLGSNVIGLYYIIYICLYINRFQNFKYQNHP